MADLKSQTAIVPVEGTHQISVKDFDAAGKPTELACPLPTDPHFETWTMIQQMVMLKRGVWSACSLPDIVWGLAYANKIGADPMMGEIFPTGAGRWGTSNKYKIKKALATGNIRSIESVIKELPESAPEGCASKKDLECTVTIEVAGWSKPIIRKARLSRWFKRGNPNWVGNPEHMLELNTVAHACEFIPGGTSATEEDEAPPPPPTTMEASQVERLMAINDKEKV
jgi:hypothetical protein